MAALNSGIADGNTEYAILLTGGVISRKTITRVGSKYRVENQIDGSVQRLTDRQLFEGRYSNIGKAMKKGAFVSTNDVTPDEPALETLTRGVWD